MASRRIVGGVGAAVLSFVACTAHAASGSADASPQAGPLASDDDGAARQPNTEKSATASAT
jgi:hypothetical protein